MRHEMQRMADKINELEKRINELEKPVELIENKMSTAFIIEMNTRLDVNLHDLVGR